MLQNESKLLIPFVFSNISRKSPLRLFCIRVFFLLRNTKSLTEDNSERYNCLYVCTLLNMHSLRDNNRHTHTHICLITLVKTFHWHNYFCSQLIQCFFIPNGDQASVLTCQRCQICISLLRHVVKIKKKNMTTYRICTWWACRHFPVYTDVCWLIISTSSEFLIYNPTLLSQLCIYIYR